MIFVRRYAYGCKFEYITEEEAEMLREECHEVMAKWAAEGTPPEIVYAMGEALYNKQLHPKV